MFFSIFRRLAVSVFAREKSTLLSVNARLFERNIHTLCVCATSRFSNASFYRLRIRDEPFNLRASSIKNVGEQQVFERIFPRLRFFVFRSTVGFPVRFGRRADVRLPRFRFRNYAPRAQRTTRVRLRAPDRRLSHRRGSPHRLAPRSVRSGGHAFRAFHRPNRPTRFRAFSVGRVNSSENRPSSSVSAPASTRSRLERPPSHCRKSHAGFPEVRRDRPA